MKKKKKEEGAEGSEKPKRKKREDGEKKEKDGEKEEGDDEEAKPRLRKKKTEKDLDDTTAGLKKAQLTESELAWSFLHKRGPNILLLLLQQNPLPQVD